MPTTLDTEILAEVLEAILELETTGDFFPTTEDSFDPDTGTIPGGSVGAAFTYPCSPPLNYSNEAMQLDGIQRGDMMVLVPGISVTTEPENFEKARVGGKSWRIVSVTPYYSGEQVAAYEFQMRR